MEIILIQNVPGLGDKNDTLNVTDGYANNYLIPKGYAVLATASNKKIAQENIRQSSQKQALAKVAAENLAQQIGNLALEISVKVGEQGKLFGTVRPQDIASLLESKGISVHAKQISLAKPKSTGPHEFIFTPHKELTYKFPLTIIAQA